MDTLARFRKSVAASNHGRPRMGWRYTDEEKALALAFSHQRREEGCSLASITKELGISALTLSRWLRGHCPGGFREIAVVEAKEATGDWEEASHSLAVVTPGGLRIEGLEWSQVLELARGYS